jgi:nicotinate-nucleotide pyrophosphorylase (carboxylating)
MAEVIQEFHGKAVFEASGGVALSTVRAIAESGVNVISVGALTHSAPSLAFHLELNQG